MQKQSIPEIPFSLCKCMNSNGVKSPDVHCSGLPNRFRKILNPGRFWPLSERKKGEGSLAPFSIEEAAAAEKQTDKEIKSELGDNHCLVWCQSMEPKIWRK